MTCQLTKETIDRTVAFHGHWCPGLAGGIRAAEWALSELGARSEDEELVAVVETDMCGVDAIQYLTGCTFGKGNLVYRDYGKNAFTFYRRSDGKAARLVMRCFGRDAEREELDDGRVLRVLSTYSRKVKDQISSSRDAGRDDLMAQAENELSIVSEFMPAELSDAELIQVIAETIDEIGASGPKDMGRVMKTVLPKVAGKADGGRVSTLVKQQLSQ